MRLFVAVPIPPDVAAAASRLLPDLPALRRVAPALMHITVAFVGDAPEDQLPTIAAAVAEGARGQRAFEVTLENVGRFPESGAPRVVWLGAGHGALELIRVADRVRHALTARGVAFDDKPFRPHLTLARVREGADRDALRAIAAAVAGARPPGPRFTAEGVFLLQSELSPKGPKYTPRAAVPFDAGGG